MHDGLRRGKTEMIWCFYWWEGSNKCIMEWEREREAFRHHWRKDIKNWDHLSLWLDHCVACIHSCTRSNGDAEKNIKGGKIIRKKVNKLAIRKPLRLRSDYHSKFRKFWWILKIIFSTSHVGCWCFIENIFILYIVKQCILIMWNTF